MPHSYSSEYPPGVQADEGIKAFFEEFYRTTDDPNAHETYVDYFAEGGTLIMASKKGVGRDEILAIRKGAWQVVASRLHTVFKIFPFGAGSTEVMLYGNVAYGLKDGRKSTVEWGARAQLVQESGSWKLGFYQVYLDTAAMQNAK